MRVFETRTATGRKNFAYQDRIVFQIFILLISNGEKILSKCKCGCVRQVKMKNNFLLVAVGVSKTRVRTSTQDTERGIFFALRRLDRNCFPIPQGFLKIVDDRQVVACLTSVSRSCANRCQSMSDFCVVID